MIYILKKILKMNNIIKISKCIDGLIKNSYTINLFDDEKDLKT